MSSKKVFVLGLDGATFDLILPWVSEGRLPAFSRLISEGAWGELESVPNQRSGAAWTSFMTGKNPGKHGIFEFYEYLPSSYNLRFINSRDRDGESLWQILSQLNKKVGVINVPMTYPAEEVNGFLVAGLDSPSTKSKGFTYPSHLLERLPGEFGDYILEPGLTGAIVGGNTNEAVDMLQKELRQKMEVSNYLMKNSPWEFFMVVLRSLDAAQHCFWKYMDSTHPDFNTSESRQYGNTILDTYRMIDGFIGELMTSLDDDTNLVVMSDHGFGKKHPANNQLNQWLKGRGLLFHTISSKKKDGGLLSKIYREVIGKTPRRAKEWLWENLPSLRDEVQSRLCFSNMDWPKTRAYSDTLFPNIRINLKGRELKGVVEPGKEYEELIKVLISELKDLRDMNSGEKIVDKVFRQEEIYHGKYTDNAPDLLIRWREDLIISGIKLSDGDHFSEPFIPAIPGEDCRVISGDHHLKGIFLSWGKNIRKGIEIEGARIMDLAPTILSIMGESVPEDMDGKVISRIFDGEFLKGNPISYHKNLDGGKGTSIRTPHQYTHEEKEEIEVRLRGLGYLE